MKDKETRTVTAPIERADDVATGESKLIGHAALFNSEAVIAGFFREVIAPGAFTEALKRKDDVRALFNHDANFVLGRTAAGTLTLSEDKRGLKYEVTTPSTSWAKDLVLSIARGDVSQSSFAFRVERESWPKVERDALPLRVIEQVELFDVSPVTYPAYEDTTVSARDRAKAAVDAALILAAQPNEQDRRARELRKRELSLRELPRA